MLKLIKSMYIIGNFSPIWCAKEESITLEVFHFLQLVSHWDATNFRLVGDTGLRYISDFSTDTYIEQILKLIINYGFYFIE